MHQPPLRLYVDSVYTSPYAMSVFVTLREKGLAFDTVTLDLDAGQNQAADFARLSVTRRVPTLVEGDFALSESSAITEYLEQVYPATPVYPADPRQRARARQVQAWLRSDMLPIRQERSTLVVFRGQKRPPLSPEAEAAANKLISAAEALLVGNPANLFGEWSIADVDLAVMLNRLILNGDRVPAALVDYAQRQWQRPSVQAWVNLPRPAL
ncbi:Glutathione S-transferase YfcF [Pseudomonas extremaustralis]|uniref:glutathione transferase n=1 Tax=Pseudomonas extremaustralis TaxID=359110 RepID=UPI002AA0D9A5|nr:glutathione transferase [Pseudomonas extremaustralis]MDY7066957.1 Glutathione S-transferase YfcF [Pseudomonas extremaustralis]